MALPIEEKKNHISPFKLLVEKYVENPIKTLFTDGGTQYLILKDFIATHGISRLTHHHMLHNIIAMLKGNAVK